MAVANSFIFGNINTADYDVVIEGYGNYTAPKRAVEMVSVPGRNGAVVLDLGYYENGSASFVCVIQAFDQDEFAEKVARFRNAIVSQLGYQRLTEGYLPGEYRMAMYSGGLDDEPEFIGRAGKFEVNFNCKPQRWLTSGESAVTVSDGDSFYNPTPFDASPLLMVEGYGTIGFNGYDIEIENAVMGEVELVQPISGSRATSPATISKESSNNGDTIILGSSTLAVSITGNGSLVTTGHSVPTITSNLGATLRIEEHVGFFDILIDIPTLQLVQGTSRTITDTVTVSVDLKDVIDSQITRTVTHSFTVICEYNSTGSYYWMRSPLVRGDYVMSSDQYTKNYRGSITVDSTLSILGHPTYIDCDLGDAYMIKDGAYISLNSYIDLGSDLPVLASGNNPVTIDNTITELKVVPRFWIL